MHRNGGGAIGDLLPLPLLAAPLGMGSSLVLMVVMTTALLALTSTSLGPPFLCHDTLAWRLLTS